MGKEGRVGKEGGGWRVVLIDTVVVVVGSVTVGNVGNPSVVVVVGWKISHVIGSPWI